MFVVQFLMFCFSYKNGSLTRERIRDKCSEQSWEKFGHFLDTTPKGNNGNIGQFCHNIICYQQCSEKKMAI